MRRTIIWAGGFAAAFFVGLKVGGFLQHQKTGYIYEIRRQKTYSWPIGDIKLEYATESVGLPFLDPGTTAIVLEEPSGLEFTLYKARRGFQESYPYLEELVVTDNQVQWDDGCYFYTLQIERSKRGDRDATSYGEDSDEATRTQVHSKSGKGGHR